jgi:hypothetical protein
MHAHSPLPPRTPPPPHTQHTVYTTTHLKSRFWMRVLITSSGCATVMEATAPATEAMESCMNVASEYFSSCRRFREIWWWWSWWCGQGVCIPIAFRGCSLPPPPPTHTHNGRARHRQGAPPHHKLGTPRMGKRRKDGPTLKTRSLTRADPPNSAKEPGALRAAVHVAPLLCVCCLFVCSWC